MFEKYGTDYAHPTLQLNELLPSVNQSEASNSILSTLFQRWLTKPNLTNVAGTIGFARTPIAGIIQETTPYRQAYQLHPTFYCEQGDQKRITDWNDILRKIAFTGVDPLEYDQWGSTTAFDFRPPIDFDKFVNYSSYYWVNEVDTVEQPNYVTITANAHHTNDWSYDLTTLPIRGGWIHKNDIGNRLAYAKQAQVPIIEFDDIELCRWFKVVRTWKKFDHLTNTYIATSEQPIWSTVGYVPSSSADEGVDSEWELQSETLVPVGSPPTDTLNQQLTQLYCKYVSTNHTDNTARFEIHTTSTSGIVRQYLRGQNDIVVFAGNEFAQIVNFTEVESQLGSQYGKQIDIPLTALSGIEYSTLYAYIGAHSTFELNRGLGKKPITLADDFTSYTPTSGVKLARTQYRSLYEYKLLGQRKLSKYQLPLFNLYTPQPTGGYVEQTTAGYVLRYNQDTSASVDNQLGQRVATTLVDVSFTIDLVTKAGELLTYKRNDVQITPDCDAHYTIWRGQPTAGGVDLPVIHTPAYVNSARVPVSKTEQGGWEPSQLLTSNPLRETRSQFKLSEVVNHFQKLAVNLPGTITISDDGGNYLVSSLLSDGLSVPTLIEFIATELATYRSQFEQQIKMQMFSDTTLRATPISQLASTIYQTLRARSFTEGGSNSIYDDTLSYDSTTGFGYPNFPLTFGVLGLATLVDVVVETDRKLNHATLTTHDGTLYSVTITPREYASIEAALSTDVVVGLNPTPTANYCIWQKTATESYRFECYYFSTSSPAAPALGATWFNPTSSVAAMWTGSQWRMISTSELWVAFDVADVLLTVLSYQERDIATLIASRTPTTLPTKLNIHSVGATDTTRYGALIKRDFVDFAFAYQQRDLADQAVSYMFASPSPTNPFTWNYGSNYPSTPSVYQLYLTKFGTALPHKYPWKMQGYATKPTWWDVEYTDPSGARRWSSVMWSNIASGTIPQGRPLADGTIGTNIAGQYHTTYDVIPVNCTAVTYYGYAPDDLLPPYVNTQDQTYGVLHPLLPYTLIPAQVTAAPPTIQNPTATLGEYLIFSTAYASGNHIDNIWRTSSTAISRHLHVAYATNPIQFVTNILTNDFNIVGGVRINPKTNNVSRNTDPLHGEGNALDHSLFAALTFISRRLNFAALDTSPLATWKSWSTRLTYQTNTLIVPQTLKIYQDCYDLTEYSIILKKSENIRRIPFSNVIITLASVGDSSTSTGRGENWIFKVSCSEIASTVRHRYAPLQQEMVWNPASKSFTVNSIDRFRWVDGEAVQLVHAPASVFYVSTVGGLIRLYASTVDAVMGTNALDFVDGFAGPVVFRTVKATFTAGSMVWETVEVDRRSSVKFSFADDILITGVQSLIDFVVCYTEYMQDDGIVINAGTTPTLDPDTNAVISWQQQITKAVDRIFASNGLSTNGYRPVFVPGADGKLRPLTADRMYIDTPFVEINPFRNAVYFNTPDGIICDFNHTPYVNDPMSRAAIYDDTATPISSAELIPLRTDRLTSVVFNDQQPARPVAISQDASRRIAFGEISLDFYEHAIIFDQQTSNGLTIFDRFFNLQKASLNLEMQKSTDFYYRPVMGGFAVTDAGTLPNFETIAEYQRNDYDVTESNELVQSTIDSRQMLGKTPLSYFQNIPVTSKTEFQFWQQLIREKGTKGAINAFTRHQLYDDVKYDEFWAWKLGTFGAVVPRKQIEMVLQADDALHTATSFYFSSTTAPASSFGVQQVTPLNQTRWVDFPDYLDQVGSTGVTFTDTRVYNIKTGDGTGYFTSLGDKFVSIEYNTSSTTTPVWEVIPVSNYEVLGACTVCIISGSYNLRKQNGFRVTGLMPAYGQCSPIRVVDVNSKIVVKTMSAWDPANSIHTTAIAHFDYCVSEDPASYNRTVYNPTGSTWGIQQIGQYMVRSTSLVYKPYFDTTAFPLLDDRTRYWGQLADGYKPTAYQWVESSTAPTIRSIDAPLTRVLEHSRADSKVPITSISSTTTFVCSSPLPLQYHNTMLVNLYKTNDSTSSALSAYIGTECMIMDIDSTRTSFTLLSNGTTLTVPTGTSVSGLFIVSTWSDAVVKEILPLSHMFYVRNNHQLGAAFQLPWTNVVDDINTTATGELVKFVQHDLTNSATVVNVDGITVAFGVTAAGSLTIYDEYHQPFDFSTRPVSVVTVYYSESTAAATGRPTIASSDLTYLEIDVPHVEYTRIVDQLPVTNYYYWSANPTTQSLIKSVPLSVAVDNLLHPPSDAYIAIHADRQLLTVWGLYGIHQLDSKALAIDIDVTMRDRYVAPSVSKNTNEQWILFREYQDGYPNQCIWNSIVATITGVRTVNSNSTIIIPSPDRVSYDYLYDTTLSYGTGLTQSLISPIRARELFIEFFSTTNPLIDSTWHALLSSDLWLALVNSMQYAKALTYVYTYLPPTLLNSFIFVILREGLYSGYHYDGLFKTSFVALQTSQKVVVG